MPEHTYMMRQNLADIEFYASAMLNNLERGAGELPQWTSHVISTVRAHMHDVVHFLRHQAREGRQYGQTPAPGFTREKVRMMVQEWGQPVERFRGRLRKWAQAAKDELEQKRRYAGHHEPESRQYGMSGRGMSPWYGQAGVETTGKQFYAGDARPEGQRRYAGHGGADEIQGWLVEAAGWDDGTRRYGFVWESIDQPIALSRVSKRRKYGVPGIPYPQRGWWGQGGVATADSPFLAGPRRYAGSHEPASIARKNLRDIAEAARQAAGHLQHGAGIAPSWLEHKLSIAAGSMDSMGHWLENEGVEGRKYGTHLNSSPEDAKTIAQCYGYADGLGDIYTGPKWEGGPYRGDYERAHREGVRDSNRGDAQKLRAECYGKADGIRENYLGHLWDDSEHEDSYNRAWSEGYGASPAEEENGQRLYGQRGDGGDRARREVSAGGHRAGPGYQPHPRRRGRFWKKHPHRHVPYHPVWGYVPWMHPGNGIDHRTGFQTDVHLGEPEPVPHVTKVYAHMVREQLLPEIPDSHAVIGMLGSGFSAIDVPVLRIRYKLNGAWREDDAPITKHTDGHLEIALPISKQVVHSFELTDLGYFESGDFVTMSHSFFQATKHPYRPFSERRYGRAFKDPDSVRRYALNLAQKFEGPPGPMRPHSQAEGLRFYGMTPGEAVDLQTPMGYVQRPWRSLSPGYGPVQEYGSMGYGSMGTGSMDRAVQQAMLQRTKGSQVP